MNRYELQHGILNVLNNQEGKHPDFSHTVQSIMDLVYEYAPETQYPEDRPVMLNELWEAVWGVFLCTNPDDTAEMAFRRFSDRLNELRD